jgi:hypothetical protein
MSGGQHDVSSATGKATRGRYGIASGSHLT